MAITELSKEGNVFVDPVGIICPPAGVGTG